MLGLVLGSPGHAPVITTIVVIAGMIVLAVVDVWREEVEDLATGTLLIVAGGGLVLEGISPAQWVSGAVSAVAAFTVYLALGMRGLIGGGDVKLAVVPALVLGAANPFAGVWWVAVALLVQQVMFAVFSLALRPAAGGPVTTPLALPHVPAMTVAMGAATILLPALW